jgi:hypothetical protein
MEDRKKRHDPSYVDVDKKQLTDGKEKRGYSLLESTRI